MESPEDFRLWVEEKGFAASLLFVGMVALQVVVALIPGEPLEIVAGIAFGSFEGTVLCLLGIVLGSTIVFLLVRRFGVKLVEVFFSMEKIRNLKILQNKKRIGTLFFLVMTIPGTPKDLLSYFVGLTPMKLSHWLVLCVLTRIPSVVTSTVGGDALQGKEYLFAVVLFAATALISVLGAYLYGRFTERKEKKKK